MLISFDIGIKNMAYCIFSCDSSGLTITDWNILNLMEQSSLPKHNCTCLVGKPKKRNHVVPDVICGRNAKYRKSDTFYCETHAKSTGDYMIPKKTWSSKSLQKIKVEDVRKTYNEFIPAVDDVNPKRTKKQMIDSLLVFFQERCYDPIVPTKEKTASETDLITIGRNMKTAMDRIDLSQCTHAILENQISPIASRMKTVQGMLAQYFIMKCPEPFCIEFVSSSNKLKIGGRVDTTISVGVEPTNGVYKQHKLDAVYYCRKILEKNSGLSAPWHHILESKKRDDLADCFLQGIWYLRNQKKITVTDDFLVQPI